MYIFKMIQFLRVYVCSSQQYVFVVPKLCARTHRGASTSTRRCRWVFSAFAEIRAAPDMHRTPREPLDPGGARFPRWITPHLWMMSYLFEAGFSVVAVIKSKRHAKKISMKQEMKLAHFSQTPRFEKLYSARQISNPSY